MDLDADRPADFWRHYQINMFIQPNKTKSKLKQGLPVYGVISTSDDPQLAELFGIAGFDYYMLDAEHGLLDPAQAVNVVRAYSIRTQAGQLCFELDFYFARRLDARPPLGFPRTAGKLTRCLEPRTILSEVIRDIVLAP